VSNTVISVDSLSKRYRLGVISHKTLTHDLQSWWARARGKDDPNAKIHHSSIPTSETKNRKTTSEESIWALKDVSFEVKQGEVLGIIGRNGAGKSTLLKILSRVTAPTSGAVKVKGRVASLLEVGTGFHPELTGRENIYLNGAILGMSRREIDRKFDEIVDFAEVEKFIDTPVKRYSSGMYVRLAFAVAAHLEPEILVVDEVLAVGDAEFQKKCLGTMGDIAKGGRTVLFVSHNMSSIQALASRCLSLQNGVLAKDGPTQEIVEQYLALSFEQRNYFVKDLPRDKSLINNNIKIYEITPYTSNEFDFYFDAPLLFQVVVSSSIERDNLSFGVTVLDFDGSPIFSAMSPKTVKLLSTEKNIHLLQLDDTRLAPGAYQLALSIFSGGLNEARTILDVVNPAITFHIAPFTTTGEPVVNWQKSWYGPISHRNIKVVNGKGV